MRSFIISDLHGCGKVYYPIMHFLENLSKKDDITLYINGDLIDRGKDSAAMLLDVKIRMLANPFKIEYLAGNHELMMFETFQRMIKGYNVYKDDWFHNGGLVTFNSLTTLVDNKKDMLEIIDFISNLKIFHKFQETIDQDNIVLIHAACPRNLNKELVLKDDDYFVEYALWTREGKIPVNNTFSIIGHTPNENIYGVEYLKEDNCFNIDGGCAPYALGYKEYNHVPLVEVLDNSLRILTFNHNNEIIYGNYFINKELIPMEKEELAEYRSLCKSYERIKKR